MQLCSTRLAREVVSTSFDCAQEKERGRKERERREKKKERDRWNKKLEDRQTHTHTHTQRVSEAGGFGQLGGYCKIHPQPVLQHITFRQ